MFIDPEQIDYDQVFERALARYEQDLADSGGLPPSTVLTEQDRERAAAQDWERNH